MLSRVFKSAARVFKSSDQRAREAAEMLGLRVDPGSPFTQMDQAFFDEGMARLQCGGIRALEELYVRKYITKRRHISGRRAYAILEGVAGNLVSSELPSATAERLAEDFREQWREAGRGPFASAMLAQILFNTGYTYRGTGWANSVSKDAWRMFGSYCEQAHDVLLESSSGASQCPYWHRVLVSIGLSDGADPDELARRFQRAQAYDPLDLDIYWTRSYQLLPRWHGSHEEHEKFALQSVADTKQELGMSIYARIYANISDDEDVPETGADWALMKRGFEDWVARVDSQRVYNVYANLAHQFGDQEALKSLFSGRITEYHSDGWHSAEQAASVMEEHRK